MPAGLKLVARSGPRRCLRAYYADASGSACVGCDQKSRSAWALDYDGVRAGAPVQLDAVYNADVAETALYPDVVNSLVDAFTAAARGTGCLLVYGQAEAGKEALIYGELGSRAVMTPRGLPAPGHQPSQRASGLALAMFRSLL